MSCARAGRSPITPVRYRNTVQKLRDQGNVANRLAITQTEIIAISTICGSLVKASSSAIHTTIARAGGAGPIDHERAEPFALVDPENRTAFAASRVHPEVRGEDRAAAASRASPGERPPSSVHPGTRGSASPAAARCSAAPAPSSRAIARARMTPSARHHRDDRERRDHREYHLEFAHGCELAHALSGSRFLHLIASRR